MIRLARARHAWEAHIWKAALEAEGIRCHVLGEFGIGEHAAMPELWVAQDDAPFALEILAVYRSAAESGDYASET